MLDLPDFVGCSFIKSIVSSYQNFSDWVKALATTWSIL
jgi:hypothetical protein